MTTIQTSRSSRRKVSGDGFPIRVVRRGGFLSGVSPADDEALRELPAEFTLTGIRQKRSLPQLRLFWVIMQIVAENSEQDITKEELAAYMKVTCGLGTPVKSRSGKVTMVPRSISFSQLDQDEFGRFFDRVLVLVEKMMPGISAEAQARLGGMMEG